jgi:hypothetical protein
MLYCLSMYCFNHNFDRGELNDRKGFLEIMVIKSDRGISINGMLKLSDILPG